MQFAHSALFIFHVVIGSMALLLFWVPIFSRKGSIDHKQFGKYFFRVMYLVAASGAAMATMVLIAPLYFKGHLMSPGTDPDVFSSHIRAFWAFLLALSLLSYVSTRQGHLVFRLARENKLSDLRKPAHRLPIVFLAISGLGLLYLGATQGRTLHMIFGVLSVLVSIGSFRFTMRTEFSKFDVLQEHFSALIGSGIGAYTAFITFGARQLLQDWGQWQILFWIAPGIIGSIAISILSRKHSPAPKATKLSTVKN